MALRSLMLKKNLDDLNAEIANLRETANGFSLREAELADAINEANTDEEKATVEQAINDFEAEKKDNAEKISTLSERVSAIEKELAEAEKKQEAPAVVDEEPVKETEIRTELKNMSNAIATVRAKKLFSGMTIEQRTEMFEREDVKKFMSEVRSCISEKRALTNVGLTIPEVYLGLIRENIENYSKLYKYVNVKPLKGTGRMTVMGTYPEAVWTEMCANLNELSLGFNEVEVDGYKVGGYIAVCNANIEDSDVDLAAEIITALGQAIGLALDKAILYGTGTKMPLGIVTRLVQTSEPASYPANARPWVDLHTTNVKSLSAELEGITLFKELTKDSGAAKGKYSRGAKVWAMNETTYTALKAEMLSINAAGAIVSGIEGTMPVIGGDIVVLDFIPDNIIIGGYFDLYLVAERSGQKLGQSEHVKFLEDQTVFKGTARYDGLPVIAEGFVAFALNGGTVTANAVSFAEDSANPQ